MGDFIVTYFHMNSEDGFDVFGPFETEESALAFCERHVNKGEGGWGGRFVIGSLVVPKSANDDHDWPNSYSAANGSGAHPGMV